MTGKAWTVPRGQSEETSSVAKTFTGLLWIRPLGSEIKKTRPAVIVSNNSCNTFGSRVVVLPLTSNVDSLYPGEARVLVNGTPARVLGDQIRSLDKSRLQSRIDRLSPDELAAVDDAIRITLALHPE